jgi:toxin ParE1/3/4
MNIVVEKTAENEFDEAIGWYEDRERGVGLEFAADIRKILLEVAKDPVRWPVVQGKKRMAPCGKWPFVVIYTLRTTFVRVIAIFHTSRNPQEWMSRA